MASWPPSRAAVRGAILPACLCLPACQRLGQAMTCRGGRLPAGEWLGRPVAVKVLQTACNSHSRELDSFRCVRRSRLDAHATSAPPPPTCQGGPPVPLPVFRAACENSASPLCAEQAGGQRAVPAQARKHHLLLRGVHGPPQHLYHRGAGRGRFTAHAAARQARQAQDAAPAVPAGERRGGMGRCTPFRRLLHSDKRCYTTHVLPLPLSCALGKLDLAGRSHGWPARLPASR